MTGCTRDGGARGPTSRRPCSRHRTDMHLVDAPRSARFAAFARPSTKRRNRASSRRGVPLVGAATGVPVGHRVDPRPARQGCSFAAPAASSCSTGVVALSASGVLAVRRVRRASRARARRVGVVVVSGLARGVDAEAHRVHSARARPSRCSAAGSTVTTRARTPRWRRDRARGTDLSEYPPASNRPLEIPARNRLVSGLTLRDGGRGGARAERRADHGRLALDEGRDVPPCPANHVTTLRGTNHLLRLGAVPVTCPRNVLRVLGVDLPAAGDRRPSSATRGPCAESSRCGDDGDEVAQATGRSAPAVAAALPSSSCSASSRRWRVFTDEP